MGGMGAGGMPMGGGMMGGGMVRPPSDPPSPPPLPSRPRPRALISATKPDDKLTHKVTRLLRRAWRRWV